MTRGLLQRQKGQDANRKSNLLLKPNPVSRAFIFDLLTNSIYKDVSTCDDTPMEVDTELSVTSKNLEKKRKRAFKSRGSLFSDDDDVPSSPGIISLFEYL